MQWVWEFLFLWLFPPLSANPLYLEACNRFTNMWNLSLYFPHFSLILCCLPHFPPFCLFLRFFLQVFFLSFCSLDGYSLEVSLVIQQFSYRCSSVSSAILSFVTELTDIIRDLHLLQISWCWCSNFAFRFWRKLLPYCAPISTGLGSHAYVIGLWRTETEPPTGFPLEQLITVCLFTY